MHVCLNPDVNATEDSHSMLMLGGAAKEAACFLVISAIYESVIAGLPSSGCSKLLEEYHRHSSSLCHGAQFARMYPLGQRDVPVERRQVDMGPRMPSSVKVDNPSRDYTPPSEFLWPTCCDQCKWSPGNILAVNLRFLANHRLHVLAGAHVFAVALCGLNVCGP